MRGTLSARTWHVASGLGGCSTLSRHLLAFAEMASQMEARSALYYHPADQVMVADIERIGASAIAEAISWKVLAGGCSTPENISGSEVHRRDSC